MNEEQVELRFYVAQAVGELVRTKNPKLNDEGIELVKATIWAALAEYTMMHPDMAYLGPTGITAGEAKAHGWMVPAGTRNDAELWCTGWEPVVGKQTEEDRMLRRLANVSLAPLDPVYR